LHKIAQISWLNTPRSWIRIGDGANNAHGAQGLVMGLEPLVIGPVPSGPPGYEPVTKNCKGWKEQKYILKYKIKNPGDLKPKNRQSVYNNLLLLSLLNCLLLSG